MGTPTAESFKISNSYTEEFLFFFLNQKGDHCAKLLVIWNYHVHFVHCHSFEIQIHHKTIHSLGQIQIFIQKV
jgi:hypothetical protein